MKYIVVDVGCLECQNISEVLGVYDTLDEAQDNHSKAVFIQNNNNIRYAESQQQILTFPPTVKENDFNYDS